MWYVYIIECADGSFYTGITQNLRRRFKEHKRKGSHYTSYNQAIEFLYKEKYIHRKDAEKREAQIKRWSRAKKSALIQGNLNKLKELSKSRD